MLGMHKALKVMIGMLELQLMHIFSKGKNVSKCELVPQKKAKYLWNCCSSHLYYVNKTYATPKYECRHR